MQIQTNTNIKLGAIVDQFSATVMFVDAESPDYVNRSDVIDPQEAALFVIVHNYGVSFGPGVVANVYLE